MSGKIDSSDYSSSLQIGALPLFVPRCVGIHWDDKVKSFALQVLDEKWWQKWFTFERCGVPFFQTQFASQICK